jgi:nucleotide-binding universal stress UspA family protein
MYERLLLATDGSALSRSAERHAIGIAGVMGAELVVLQVAPKLSRTLLNPTVAAARMDLKDVERFWIEAGEDYVGPDRLP